MVGERSGMNLGKVQHVLVLVNHPFACCILLPFRFIPWSTRSILHLEERRGICDEFVCILVNIPF